MVLDSGGNWRGVGPIQWDFGNAIYYSSRQHFVDETNQFYNFLARIVSRKNCRGEAKC